MYVILFPNIYFDSTPFPKLNKRTIRSIDFPYNKYLMLIDFIRFDKKFIFTYKCSNSKKKTN